MPPNVRPTPLSLLSYVKQILLETFYRHLGDLAACLRKSDIKQILKSPSSRVT